MMQEGTYTIKNKGHEDFLNRMKEQKKLSREIIDFLKEKEITYELAIEALKDTLFHLERMSLNQKI